jgi:hypothetical protein
VKTRQNPLQKVESMLQRMVERPFASIFHSKLQPAQVLRRLERAMEDNAHLLGGGRQLAPEVYDIYLSFKDHQELHPLEATLLRDWQQHLIEFARQHRYTLRSGPLLRLHPRSDLRPGEVSIEAHVVDKQHMDQDAEGGIAATQAISSEQLERIRNQMSQSQAGTFSPGMVPGYAPGGASNPNAGSYPPTLPPTPVSPMPPAWLTIRLPQLPEKMYRIEKPVIKIGRQLDNDIIVEDKRVSRYHAQIKFELNGQFTIYDLGSTNGITVNGTPHLRQHMLRSGDHFTIGSYDFNFERR